MPKRNIGKRKKKGKKKEKKTQAQAQNLGRPKLRYAVGTRVECKMSETEEIWKSGEIIAHWWRNPRWPPGEVAPYQVLLDDRMKIFVPMDDIAIIRITGELPPPLRFEVGRRIECKIVVDRITKQMAFVPGVIVQKEFPNPQNFRQKFPYQIKLDNGKLIVAPIDSNDFVREDPNRPGEVQEIRNFNKEVERRFAVGDTVECKVDPIEEIWEYGTVLELNVKHPNSGVVLPYSIRLHGNHSIIYAPDDTDVVIRTPVAPAPKKMGLSALKNAERRFKVGDRVECRIGESGNTPGSTPVFTFMPGRVQKLNHFHKLNGKAYVIPYIVRLDRGDNIIVPHDRAEIIRQQGHEEELECLEILNETINTESQTGGKTTAVKTSEASETNLDDSFFEDAVQDDILDLD